MGGEFCSRLRLVSKVQHTEQGEYVQYHVLHAKSLLQYRKNILCRLTPQPHPYMHQGNRPYRDEPEKHGVGTGGVYFPTAVQCEHRARLTGEGVCV